MNAGYYISDPGSAIEFPIRELYGSEPYSIEESDIELTTDRGVIHIYKKFRRYNFVLRFRGTWAEISFFRTLHLAVGGRETPFWFIPDMANPSVAYYVRKETSFFPKELTDPVSDGTDGGAEALYDYDFILTGVPAPGSVSA